MILPYICELMLLGGIINKGKNTCLFKKGQRLEPSYLFDKNLVDTIIKQSVNQIIENGKIKDYYEDFKAVLKHPYIYKPDLVKILCKVFLQTPYYHIVKQIISYIWGYECALCTSKTDLHVHHRTYAHRGSEHLHMRDLILLCAECYGRQHGK